MDDDEEENINEDSVNNSLNIQTQKSNRTESIIHGSIPRSTPDSTTGIQQVDLNARAVIARETNSKTASNRTMSNNRGPTGALQRPKVKTSRIDGPPPIVEEEGEETNPLRNSQGMIVNTLC